jgi:Holliday junction resolvase RusA-like endonuclease
MSIQISVPLPSKELSPNARVHWRVKAKATKSARQHSGTLGLAHGRPMWKSANVRCVFTFGDKRPRDKDNLLASMKAYFDGLADAGIIENDSQLIYLPVEITAPDRLQKRVVIHIEQTEASE